MDPPDRHLRPDDQSHDAVHGRPGGGPRLPHRRLRITGKFTLGNCLANDARGSYFKGNLADVKVWKGAALNAVQVATMANITLPKAPYTFADVADADGDGKADLVSADATGSLWLYPGNGNGGWSSAATYIGSGLSTHTFAGIGDFNSDAKPDVIVRDTTGALWLYPGNGSNGFGARSQIGTGWNGYTFAGIGDFNSAGTPDVIARDDATGILWLYPCSATAFGTRQQIGSGW
ncbi:hypothetical protein QFZ56_007877 [Streptomyces achromogenes]|uniref:VCBS repeat-containing protein n=2 Tax=Streptomyces achromogenes TaxID=67255 RepID=A0ABU0QE26_STRAH|nr:VCBS repeat-containing protein [Streptomyces achromogenes]MDQ0688914.1 hypothetical protein [Streptomyces achromogenes]